MYSKIPLVRPVLRANTTDTRVIKNKKNLDISVESQITRNFVKNPFGNCRPPLEVFHFFRSERKTTVISSPFAKFSSFQSRISRKQLRKIELQMVSAISFGWFADFGKTLTLFNDRPNQFILRGAHYPITICHLKLIRNHQGKMVYPPDVC